MSLFMYGFKAKADVSEDATAVAEQETVETHRPDSVGLDTTVTTTRSGCKHHCDGQPRSSPYYSTNL